MAFPLFLASALFGQTSLDAIRSTITQYNEAVRVYDSVALDRHFHPDYVEVSPVGEVDSRARTLSFYKLPEGKKPASPDSISLDELSVRMPTKDVAIAIFRLTMTFKNGEQKFDMQFRATSCLKLEKGKWLIFGTQAVGMRPKPPVKN